MAKYDKDFKLKCIKALNSKQPLPKECIYKVDIDNLLSRWLEIVASFKLNQLKEITDKEVGAAIKRLEKYMNIIENK